MKQQNLHWVEACVVNDLSDGSIFQLDNERDVVAVGFNEGNVFAVSDMCPHEFAYLSDGEVVDGCIECPLHQARFDVKSGAVISGPGGCALTVYATKVEGDKVFVGFPA